MLKFINNDVQKDPSQRLETNQRSEENKRVLTVVWLGRFHRTPEKLQLEIHGDLMDYGI